MSGMQFTQKINFCGFILSAVFGLFILSPLSLAYTLAQRTEVSLTVQAGSLSIISPSKISFGTITSLPRVQVTQGIVPDIRVTDFRGLGAGWTAGYNASSLGIRGESVRKTKINNGVNSSASVSDLSIQGTYDGFNSSQLYSGDEVVSPPGDFVIKVEEVGASPQRPSFVTIKKPDGTNVRIVVLNDMVSFNGFTVNFAAGNGQYAINDWFYFQVDSFPQRFLTATTSALTASNSATDNIVLNPPFSTSSFHKVDALAEWGSGMGSYNFDDTLAWTIHSNPLPGEYQATVIYMLQ